MAGGGGEESDETGRALHSPLAAVAHRLLPPHTPASRMLPLPRVPVLHRGQLDGQSGTDRVVQRGLHLQVAGGRARYAGRGEAGRPAGAVRERFLCGVGAEGTVAGASDGRREGRIWAAQRMDGGAAPRRLSCGLIGPKGRVVMGSANYARSTSKVFFSVR